MGSLQSPVARKVWELGLGSLCSRFESKRAPQRLRELDRARMLSGGRRELRKVVNHIGVGAVIRECGRTNRRCWRISRPSTTGIFPPQAKTFDKGHGRIEVRKIYVSDDLGDYLTFPHVGTTFRIYRYVTKLDGTELRTEQVYGVTSLVGTTKEAAAKVLALVRGHWRIENSLHWVRDVTFDEDRSQVRKGNGPRVMATLRNLAISVLRLAGASSIAKALRWCARHFDACERLIGLSTQ